MFLFTCPIMWTVSSTFFFILSLTFSSLPPPLLSFLPLFLSYSIFAEFNAISFYLTHGWHSILLWGGVGDCLPIFSENYLFFVFFPLNYSIREEYFVFYLLFWNLSVGKSGRRFIEVVLEFLWYLGSFPLQRFCLIKCSLHLRYK